MAAESTARGDSWIIPPPDDDKYNGWALVESREIDKRRRFSTSLYVGAGASVVLALASIGYFSVTQKGFLHEFRNPFAHHENVSSFESENDQGTAGNEEELSGQGENKTEGKSDVDTHTANSDPKVSLVSYSRVLGITLMKGLEFPEMKFSLYFMVYEAPKNKRNVKPRRAKKVSKLTNVDEEKSSYGLDRQITISNCSKDDASAASEINNGEISSLTVEDIAAPSRGNGKTRANRGSATDPQSLYARKRREKINERQRLTLAPCLMKLYNICQVSATPNQASQL